MGRVRNVVLMNVYLGLGGPGGSGFWVGGYEPGEGNGEVSLRATWERGGRILSQQGGFQVSGEGQKGEQRGICLVHKSCSRSCTYIMECL
jgi:hypothetical protein